MNKVIKSVWLSSAIAISAISLSVNASVIGVFGASTGEAISIASAQGYTAEVISDFSNLDVYDVIWGLNDSNSFHSSELTTFSAGLENYVTDGGVLLYHDRYVTDGNTVLPGADDFFFQRDLSSDIDLAQANDVAGLTIDDTNLDLGNSSNHGFVLESSIDSEFTAIFDNGIDGNLVDFSYEFGLGDVYYSTIPLDFYIAGNGLASFRDLYAPQVVDYAVFLSQNNNLVEVSEPASIAILSLALFGLGARRFKKRI